MSNGWQCPKCGYVWAPYYPSCDNCNRPEHEKVLTTTTIEIPADTSRHKCGCTNPVRSYFHKICTTCQGYL